jgi:hypothetical protein
MKRLDGFFRPESPHGFSLPGLLLAALTLIGCDLHEPDKACDQAPNGISFINFAGVKSDTTVFVLDSLTATLGDTLDVTSRVSGPFSDILYFYDHLEAVDGFVTLTLFKDAATKAQVTFEASAATGAGCGDETFNRKYSIVWLETTGHGGYTDVEVIEEFSPVGSI